MNDTRSLAQIRRENRALEARALTAEQALVQANRRIDTLMEWLSDYEHKSAGVSLDPVRAAWREMGRQLAAEAAANPPSDEQIRKAQQSNEAMEF